MAKDEYKAHAAGGLKLKGSKPIGVEKARKKKEKKEPEEPQNKKTDTSPRREPSVRKAQEGTHISEDFDKCEHEHEHRSEDVHEQDGRPSGGDTAAEGTGHRHKTEAERRYEEARRRRLDDRLRREGSKTHKQRVEELNRYLSGLSEHHDMPRIGPG